MSLANEKPFKNQLNTPRVFFLSRSLPNCASFIGSDKLRFIYSRFTSYQWPFCTRRRDTIFLHICLPPYHHFMMFFLWFLLQFATFHRRINFEVKNTRDFFVWDKNAAWGQWLWKKLIKEKFVCENLNAGQWLRDSMASYNWKHTSTWYSLWMTIWKDYSSIQNMYSYSLSFIHSFVSQFDVHCLLYFACAHARVLPFMCNKYTEPWWQHTKIIYVDFFHNSHIYEGNRFSAFPHHNKCYHSSAPLHKPGSCKIVNERWNPFPEECNCLCNGRACSMIFYSHFIFCYVLQHTEKEASERARVDTIL